MPNFISSTYQATLFRSVIPGDIPWSPPLSGVGSPEGRQKGVAGQLYTQTDSGPTLWCKGTTAAKTGWFTVVANAGHPTVIVGLYTQTDPNGVVDAAGPAVWYGSDQSIWVKTDSANDSSNWKLLLEFGMSVGPPTYYAPYMDSDSSMEAP